MMNGFRSYLPKLAILSGLLVSISACDSLDVGKTELPNDRWDNRENKQSVFGEGGISLGGEKQTRQNNQGGGIGVNAYLWRATLDTISFMPLASADPFGGVVLTDWHNPDNSPSERFKLNVYILGQALRSDGIRVAAFRQVRKSNEWVGAPVDPQVIVDIENSILTRARQLRADSMTQ